MKKEINYGFNIELEKQHQSAQDWVFGSTSPKCLAQIPEEVRHLYLPKGEVQRSDREDMMDCASRAIVNILETKLNWLISQNKLSKVNENWLKEKGYFNGENGIEISDAFIAINSGTTKQGNSLIAPLDALHRRGFIPKKMLPLEPWMTWDEYHDPKRITPEMYALGLESIRRLPVNYERVYEEDFEEVHKEDLLDVAGYAWPLPVNGEYPRTNRQPNHAFVSFRNPKYNVFDNYIDSDGDFLKKLASNYDLLDFGYRVIIAGDIVAPVRTNWIIQLFKNLFKWRT